MAELPIHSVIVGERLTGRFRFRPQRWTLRPVLQVEIAATRKRMQAHELDSEPTTFWRDATLEQAYQLQVNAGHKLAE